MNELELLDRAFPAPDEATVEEARQRVEPRYRDHPAPRPATRRSRRPILALAVGLAAAAALIALALDAGRGGDSTAVARTLNGLALVAGRQAPAEPGAYAYTRTRSDYGTTASQVVAGRNIAYSYHTPANTEQWLSAGGDVIRCVREGPPVLKSPADRSAWIAAGSPVLDTLGDRLGYERFQGTAPTLAGTPGDQLPTTTDQIAALVQRLKYHDAGSILENVHELLAYSLVSPASTAALFRYLATVPGLTVVPGAVTHDGRVGVGISVAGNGLTGSERWVNRFLIFDPATSHLIGYRELAPGKVATEVGHDRAWEEYISQGSATLDVPPVPKKGVESGIGPVAERFCAGLARP